MTLAGRGWLGALLGATATLLFYPDSRATLKTALFGPAASVLREIVQPPVTSLPPPTSLVEAGYWMRLAADRMRSRRDLRPGELESVLRIARAAALRDSGNGFWPQMETILLARGGMTTEARQAWLRATRATTWNDYQTPYLLKCRERITAAQGIAQSWQLAFVYHQRSPSATILIERYARRLVAGINEADPMALAIRAATVRNGALMRDGSRSMPIGVQGADLVDVASYPKYLDLMSSPKKLLLARVALYNALSGANQPSLAAQVNSDFRENDGWRAMATRQSFAEEINVLTYQSVVLASLPGALLTCAIIGGLLFAFGQFLQRVSLAASHRGPIIAAAGGLGALAIWVSGSWLSGVWLGLSTAFLLVGPRVRRSGRAEVGPLLPLLLAGFALSFGAAVEAWIIGVSTPARGNLPYTPLPDELYGDGSVFPAIAFILLGLPFVFAPLWALVQRRPTLWVVSRAFRHYGAIIGIGCLVATVLVTPMALYADRNLEARLYQLVANEPVYYLTQ